MGEVWLPDRILNQASRALRARRKLASQDLPRRCKHRTQVRSTNRIEKTNQAEKKLCLVCLAYPTGFELCEGTQVCRVFFFEKSASHFGLPIV